jgi:uncharacterized membrane protein YhdT
MGKLILILLLSFIVHALVCRFYPDSWIGKNTRDLFEWFSLAVIGVAVLYWFIVIIIGQAVYGPY